MISSKINNKVCTPNNSKLKVGVIALIADLYRKNIPDLPETFCAPWRKILPEMLSETCELYFADIVSSQQVFAAQLAELDKKKCDLLIILPLAYASSQYVLQGLLATKLPFVVVSSCRDCSMPYDITGDHLLANQAMHGVQELTNVLWRNGRNFGFLAGHPTQPGFAEKLRKFVNISSGAGIIKKGRIGLVGKPLEGMLDFLFDYGTLSEKLGFEVVSLDPTTLVAKASDIDSVKVDSYVNWMQSRFGVDGEFTAHELNANARISLALERTVEEKSLNAVAMNFSSVIAAGAEALPFMGASHLMSKSFGYAGEGDVLTAALNASLSRIFGKSTFTEMFCPDYTRKEVILSHMGECNFDMADPMSTVPVKPRIFAWGNCQRLAVPIFQLRPGDATLVSLTETPDDTVSGRKKTFQLVVTQGCILKAPDHPNLRNPYTRISFGEDLSGFLEKYSRAGGTHHLVLAHGNKIEEIRMLADLCNINCVVV